MERGRELFGKPNIYLFHLWIAKQSCSQRTRNLLTEKSECKDEL